MSDLDVDRRIAEIEGQLTFELGAAFEPVPAVLVPGRQMLDLTVVVCLRCTGHHPTERCDARVICALCTGNHPAAIHLTGSLR